MKKHGDWSLRLLGAALFVGSSIGMLFAVGAPGDEHAGYQGIPVRNGLDRGLIQHDAILAAQRYPSLPRRKNEADLIQADSVDARNRSHQDSGAPDRAGYAGIPQRKGLMADQTQPTLTPQTASVEHAGYGGIPEPRATYPMMKRSNTFPAKRGSALVKAK